jgi:archaellum component FlaC
MTTKEQIYKEIAGCCISRESTNEAVERIIKILPQLQGLDQLIEKWEKVKNELENLTIGFDDQYQVGFIDGEVNRIDEIIEDLKTLKTI